MDNNFVLIALIVITVLFSYKGFQDQSFFRKYEFHIGSISSGEQIRMISSGFLHADIAHLAFNMIALYSFANVVIGYFGSLFFLVIYLGSLLLGNIVTFFFEKNNYSYRAIGASGAVTGIIYSAILLVPFQDVYLFFIPIGIPAYIFGFIYLLYSIYGMKSKSDNIGHTAHFGGAIAGYVFTIAKLPSLLYESTWIVILLGVPIVILFVLAKMKKL
jgi:membrane associated rhomboid family serine protease